MINKPKVDIDIVHPVSALEALTLIFITLKLTKVITWSWWWILSPIWIPVIIALTLFSIFLIYYAVKQ